MIYLDYAATSLHKPYSVYSAVYDAMVHHSANPGRGGHSSSVRAAELIYETREKLCRLFHVTTPERFIFFPNTTWALNTAIKGLLAHGDHVVVSSMEHNSVMRPLEALKQQGKIAYSVVQADTDGRLTPEAFQKAMRPHTRLVICTHASNVCGNVYDIQAIAAVAHAQGALCLIDAAQSAGIVDIDASYIDLLAFPGHKSLYGPQGSGGLYVRPGLELKTLVEGGTGSQSELLAQPAELPDRFEAGTLNVPAIAGLGTAISFILTEGIESLQAHEKNLRDYFIENAQNISGITIYGDNSSINVVSLNISGIDCNTAAALLNDEYDIAVRSGLHCAPAAHRSLGTLKSGSIRFSFGYFTQKKELGSALYALNHIAKMHV